MEAPDLKKAEEIAWILILHLRDYAHNKRGDISIIQHMLFNT
jgi:hypothetical protein